MKINLIRTFLVITSLLFSSVPYVSTVLAADKDQASPRATETSPAPGEDMAGDLEKVLSGIEKQRETIVDLQGRVDKSDGILKKALEARLDKAWVSLLERGLDFVKGVADQEDKGVDAASYREQAIEILRSQLVVSKTAAGRIRSRFEIPEPDLSASEQAAAYIRVFATLDSLNHVYSLMIGTIEMSRRFELDVTGQETLLKEDLAERAANGSILLELTINNAAALRAGMSAVPDDMELKAKLSIAENNIRSLAKGLEDVVAMMENLDMDVAEYRAQMISATGEITTETFRISVLASLLKRWGEALLNMIAEDGPDLFFKVLLVFIIIFVFRKLAGIIQKITERALEKSHLQLSELLRRMIVSVVRNIVIVLGILIALSQAGISLGPLLAGLGVVGFVIGFALQDTLSNFASGLMLLIYRPFDVGDVVDAGSVFGKVSHMSLVNTTVMTLDNQKIVVPNSKIWGDVIKNVTAQTVRRVDLMFGISYSDDIPKTERILQEIVDAHDKVLPDPEPVIKLHELGDSSVNFVVRPWVNTDDYWNVYWDITRTVKMRFDEEGISIPFPQRDVHVYSEDAT